MLPVSGGAPTRTGGRWLASLPPPPVGADRGLDRPGSRLVPRVGASRCRSLTHIDPAGQPDSRLRGGAATSSRSRRTEAVSPPSVVEVSSAPPAATNAEHPAPDRTGCSAAATSERTVGVGRPRRRHPRRSSSAVQVLAPSAAPSGRAPPPPRRRAPPPAAAAPRGAVATRVNAGSTLCGSCHGTSPAAAQAAIVSARRTAEQRPPPGWAPGRIPAIDRGPEPRPSPSSTVSAWSSSGMRRAAPGRRPRRLQRPIAGPPGGGLETAAPIDRTRQHLDVEPQVRALHLPWSAACPAEPSCRPWSTVHRSSRPAPIRVTRAAAARASESAPPERQRDRARRAHGPTTRSRPRRGPLRRGPRSAVYPAHPGRRIRDLRPGRQGVGRRPHGIERRHPDLIDDGPDEGGRP